MPGATRAGSSGSPGLAEPHWVELDFGDRLGEAAATAIRSCCSCTAGSSTPTLRRTSPPTRPACGIQGPSVAVLARRAVGRAVARKSGYPAGLNHMMTLDLTGKMLPSDRNLRVSSNMDLYWDRDLPGVSTKREPSRGQEARPATRPTCTSAAIRASIHPTDDNRICSTTQPRPGRALEAHGRRLHAIRRGARLLDPRRRLLRDHGSRRRADASLCGRRFRSGARRVRKRSFVLKADSYCKDMDLYGAPNTVLA